MRSKGWNVGPRRRRSEARRARVTCTPGRTGRSSRTDARARGSRTSTRAYQRALANDLFFRFVFREKPRGRRRARARARAGRRAARGRSERSLDAIRIMHESIRPASPTPAPAAGVARRARVRRRRALAGQRAVERRRNPAKRSRAVGAARQSSSYGTYRYGNRRWMCRHAFWPPGVSPKTRSTGPARGGDGETTSARG